MLLTKQKVAVLYLSVPRDMAGGGLELWPRGAGALGRGARRLADFWQGGAGDGFFDDTTAAAAAAGGGRAALPGHGLEQRLMRAANAAIARGLFPRLLPRLEAPAVVVAPAENTLVRFRGDAYHRVQAFALPGEGGSGAGRSGGEESEEEFAGTFDGAAALGRQRVSLVLEQYRIPASHYDMTKRFEASTSQEGEAY